MKIHEYQAKELLREAGIAVPGGSVAETVEAAAEVAERVSGKVVIKAQIHAGGRGKGGGVAVVEDVAAAREAAGRILGMQLVTPQTGPAGKPVNKVLVEAAVEIAQELYLGVLIDRNSGKPMVVVSAAGGMDIEEVAVKHPEKIAHATFNVDRGLSPHHARQLVFGVGLQGPAALGVADVAVRAARVLLTHDCSLVEINPLVVTTDERVLALDAKVELDDNALYRHKGLLALRDTAEESPLELQAEQEQLNYIKLDGSVGCMVNGAGLAMATMDLIHLAGASPANFLDVGGGASVERVSAAFRILMSDPDVKAVLINIFGGIVRCDRVAQGVIEALGQVDVKVPVVVRLEGTNAREAAELLQAAAIEFGVARSLAGAAQQVVQALRGGQ